MDADSKKYKLNLINNRLPHFESFQYDELPHLQIPSWQESPAKSLHNSDGEHLSLNISF